MSIAEERLRKMYKPHKVTKLQVNNVLKTLPIGYYTKNSDITVCLDMQAETSFFDPERCAIAVSYKAIDRQMEDITKDDMTADERDALMETQIRGHLYHEVSHAILTPPRMMAMAEVQFKDVLNIFEDERIETILGGYYLGVDFIEGRAILNGYKSFKEAQIKSAKDLMAQINPIAKFYTLCRFHVGPKEFLDRKDDIIKRYENVFRMTPTSKTKAYVNEIIKLFEDYAQIQLPPEIIKQLIDSLEKRPGEGGEQGEGQGQGQGKGKGQKEGQGEGEPQEGRMKEGKGGRGAGTGFDEIVSQIVGAFGVFKDTRTRELMSIFEEMAKLEKRKACGAKEGYNGRVNPGSYMRNRENFKWFTRQGGSIHGDDYKPLCLHLIIDDSGSFSNNDKIINIFYESLRKIEKRLSGQFYFDITTLGNELHRRPKDYIHNSNEGTHLSYEPTQDVMKSLHRPNTNEFYIVCIDGYCSLTPKQNDRHRMPLEFFNNKKTICVVDTSCKEMFEQYAPMAHKKYISGNYAGQLWQSIVTLIRQVCHI